MKKAAGAIVAAFLLFMAGDALAVPAIDGMIGLGEWSSGLVINGGDPNEGTIPNEYDFKRVAMQFVDTGGADDGLYILFELWGTPTLSPLPEIGADDPFYRTILDLNGDGIFNGNDRRIDLNKDGSGIVEVFDASDTLVGDDGDGTDFDLDSVVELFIPESLFASFPFGSFQTFSRLDNGGQPEDDRIPNQGFNTNIPEPTSMLLFGSGLLSALGFARRKRNSS